MFTIPVIAFKAHCEICFGITRTTQLQLTVLLALPFPILQVIGDASPDASKLMKREGVRSVPSFHYFVGGEKVDVVNGANAEAIEAAITKHGK